LDDFSPPQPDNLPNTSPDNSTLPDSQRLASRSGNIGRSLSERTCPVCARTFYPRTGQHTYCTPVCRERARVVTRAESQAAKYGNKHQQLRRALGLKVRQGGVLCARCGEPIDPGEAWDLDHADHGNGYLGASHARCNRDTSQRVDDTSHRLDMDESGFYLDARDGFLYQAPEVTGSKQPRQVSRRW
jgi:hypothetical protein